MGSIAQTKAVGETIVKSLLSNTVLTVPIAKTVGQMVDRAVNDYRLRDLEETATTVADDELSVECSQPRATRPSEIPSDSKSLEEPTPL